LTEKSRIAVFACIRGKTGV